MEKKIIHSFIKYDEIAELLYRCCPTQAMRHWTENKFKEHQSAWAKY